MKKLLYLAASPRYKLSKSREMGSYCLEKFAERFPGIEIDQINLNDYRLPLLDENVTNARFKLPRGIELTPAEKISWGKVELEFERFNSADGWLLTTPMWNYSLPGYVKEYLDVFTHPNLIFKSTSAGFSGNLSGRSLIVIYASGNIYDTPEKMAMDTLAPALRNWNTMGNANLTLINYHSQDIRDADHEEIKLATQKLVDNAINAIKN